nr:nucleotidyltransferase family protein [uncultured Ramlibacter sp.]
MTALRAVQGMRVEEWCIGAGAVRNLVWDHLHAYSVPSKLPDVDVAHFNAQDLSLETDEVLQARLSACCPHIPWEVTNQAAVHLWFESHFGHAVPPLQSLEEAVASWPEFATCGGLSLDRYGRMSVVAPHGLTDLFQMRVRRNPARVSVATYQQRLAEKRFRERWPNVHVVPC